MNYADIKRVDVANGEGVRVSVFVSGCNHHCKGCFNQCAWDFNYGNKFTDEQIDTVLKYLDHDYIYGFHLRFPFPIHFPYFYFSKCQVCHLIHFTFLLLLHT